MEFYLARESFFFFACVLFSTSVEAWTWRRDMAKTAVKS